jgi:hypothetical protein
LESPPALHLLAEPAPQYIHESASPAAVDIDVTIGSACASASPPLLALPAPNEIQAEGESAVQLTVGQRVSLEEELGPLVVNSDGTVARISNWKQLSTQERANVLRVLGKRNKERLEALKEQAPQSNE